MKRMIPPTTEAIIAFFITMILVAVKLIKFFDLNIFDKPLPSICQGVIFEYV
jgi:hypothetical protein